MFRGPEDEETLKIPSSSFRSIAAEVTAASFLFHSTRQKREAFQRELAEALDESSDDSPYVVAGLKEAGLTHMMMNAGARLWIRGLNLSNPDPTEFSSRIKGALSDHSLQDPIALLAERGQDALGKTGGAAEVNEWLEGVEIAIRNR